ncbi:hypothetical protein MVEN_00846700 [Mycena venus]|uniref:Uncharacterized protein n=1 Tax=Mycena venus TaxID=2733690 RepID=A0A8H6YG92_9AGAR|nr:hypothetical protein MVEN_00846700 [Mycena venus]
MQFQGGLNAFISLSGSRCFPYPSTVNFNEIPVKLCRNFAVDFPLSALYSCSILEMLNSRDRQKTPDPEYAYTAPQMRTHDRTGLKPRPSFNRKPQPNFEIYTSTERVVVIDNSDAASERTLASLAQQDYYNYNGGESNANRAETHSSAAASHPHIHLENDDGQALPSPGGRGRAKSPGARPMLRLPDVLVIVICEFGQAVYNYYFLAYFVKGAVELTVELLRPNSAVLPVRTEPKPTDDIKAARQALIRKFRSMWYLFLSLATVAASDALHTESRPHPAGFKGFMIYLALLFVPTYVNVLLGETWANLVRRYLVPNVSVVDDVEK